MPNDLDNFIESGNQHFATVASDTVTWASSDYACTVSDLERDEFMVDDGTGSLRNGERLLEFALSVFNGGAPEIRDLVTHSGVEYQITEIESKDSTNVVYRIRETKEAAS